MGDIVISIERAFAQARMYGHTLQREIGFLTVHSMLHLLGYDHEAGGLEQVRMREKEESILASLGCAGMQATCSTRMNNRIRSLAKSFACAASG